MKDRTKGRVPEPFPSPELGTGSSCRPCPAIRRYRRGEIRVGVEDDDPGRGERVESNRQLVAHKKGLEQVICLRNHSSYSLHVTSRDSDPFVLSAFDLPCPHSDRGSRTGDLR